jgi:hypothetical protein
VACLMLHKQGRSITRKVAPLQVEELQAEEGHVYNTGRPECTAEQLYIISSEHTTNEEYTAPSPVMRYSRQEKVRQ